VTTASAEQTAVAAFRPWRDSSVRSPWALAKIAERIKAQRATDGKQNVVSCDEPGRIPVARLT